MIYAKAPSRFAANVFTSMTMNIARGTVGFAIGILVSRALGPAGRGELTLVASSAAILVMVASAGWGYALTEAMAKGRRTIAELFSASALVGALVGVAAGALGAAFYVVAGSHVLRVSRSTDLIWVVVVTPPLLVMNHWTGVGYLGNRIKEFGLASIAGPLFFLITAAVAQLTGHLTTSTAVALWALSSTVPLLLVIRQRRLQLMPGIRHVAAGLIRFSLRANVATLALILVWRIDVLLVDWKRGLHELGLYAVAVSLAEALLLVAVSARIALSPLQGSPDRRVELVGRICRLTRVMLAGLSLAALIIALTSGIIVRLAYGPLFDAAAPALAWILPGLVALVVQGPLIDYLITEGRVRSVSAVCVLALGVNVVINLTFLPGHSFVVAAVASTIAYVLGSGLCLALFTRQTGVRLRSLMVIERSDIAALRALWRNLFATA